MRIRTDGKHQYREDELNWARDFWGRNKTTSVLSCIEFTRLMHDNLQRAAEHPDMTPELADILSTGKVEVKYEVETGVEIDD